MDKIESTEGQAKDSQASGGSWWYLWDVPVLGYLILFGIVQYSFSVISFIGGLRNDGSLAFEAVIGSVLLLPLAGICLLLALIRILVYWPRHIRDRKRLRKLQIGVVLGLVIYLGLPFTGLLPPGYKTHTWGFRRYVRNQVDVSTIRAWLKTVDPNGCTGQDAGPDAWPVQRDDWPQPVVSMDPDYAALVLDEDGRPALRLGWSGFDALWGLTIGSEDMAIPKTRPKKRILPHGQDLYEYGQYHLPLLPGAYVWHDLG